MARERLHASNAEKVRAYREKHNLRTLTVELPADVLEGLQAYMKFKNLTKNAVIAKLITDQLLRKR